MRYSRLVASWSSVFILSVTLWALIWWFDRISLGLEPGVYLFTWGSVGNFLPFFIIFISLLLLINRLVAPFLIALASGALFYFASFKKSELLGRPLSSEDILFVRYLDRGAIDLFKSYIDIKWLVLSIVMALIFVFVFIFVESRVFRKRSIARLLVSCVFTGMLAIAGYFGSPDKFYDFRLMRFSWNDQTSVLHAGVISKIIYNFIKDKAANDEPVNYRDVDYIVDKYGSDQGVSASVSDQENMPDIIIVQSEAFSDPALFKGADELRAAVPVYAAAVEQGRAGYMKVPTFGGGTIRTEYEVLSGCPLLAYPKIEFPYMQLDSTDVDGLAAQAKKTGYSTLAIHGNTGSFWNRTEFFKKAHFDKFLTITDFLEDSKKNGFFMSDQSLTDLIIHQFDNHNERKFVFAVSIEAHGPYSSKDSTLDKYGNSGILRSLSPEAQSELQTYMGHIHNADAQLGRLHDYLEKRNKPYILAFYGDHLPSFVSVYNELSFKNGLPAKSQQVPWVVFTNVPGEAFNIQTSWALGAAIFNRAGIRSSQYLNLLNAFARTEGGSASESELQALHSVVRLQVQGKFSEYINQRVLGK
ncbi:LTA synthase family protein [Pseudomonas sp. PS01303]|uniref:LTA synthase family protein n=1 Tax=Pseudomonas sp. PS01303 TaxID=2991439 RepID=UPI00249A0263|nr:LTA synthase family protein [Pseudomonas sp. PS01303]